MPTQLSLTLARTLKNPVIVCEEVSESDPQNASMWFKRPPNSYSNYIPYSTIAWHADKEYLTWRSVGTPQIEHEHTLTAQLSEWVREHTVDEIATVLDRVPPGLGADPDTGRSFDFGAWQRLSAASSPP